MSNTIAHFALDFGCNESVCGVTDSEPELLGYSPPSTLGFFANLPVSNETRVVQMPHKWTKASRAKLSRSQKARWKKRKRQQHRKPAKRSSR